jgi:hypothetical protein
VYAALMNVSSTLNRSLNDVPVFEPASTPGEMIAASGAKPMLVIHFLRDMLKSDVTAPSELLFIEYFM